MNPTDLTNLYRSHADALAARATRALEHTGFSSLLLHSGSLLTAFQDDGTYAFRAHAPFKAWVPLVDVPDCLLFFRPGAKPILLFHEPDDFWYKPAGLPAGYWTDCFDIRAVVDNRAAREALPRDLSTTALIGDPPSDAARWQIGAVNPPALIARLDYERAAKTPYEIECLRVANRIGARGHLAAARAFEAGGSEYEIALEFMRACGAREQELPYNPIVALNEAGSVLHYQLLERSAPPERHSLLIDAGAQFAGYASDITRTYAHHDSEFAALIAQMDELQQSLCGTVRAGIDWRDVHVSAHRLIAELLREADIITVDAEQAVETGLSSVFFPHGLGHLLGVQVHDVGGLQAAPAGGEIPRPDGHPYLRLTRVLEERFVVTMEPGFYFIEPLLAAARADIHARHINWSRVESLKRFGGIRIEDDLAITASGAENLTREALRTTAIGTAARAHPTARPEFC